MLRSKYVWPARHASYAGSPADGLPFGARLRLKRPWYEAHKDDFAGVPRIILEAMHRYGLVVADVGADFAIGTTQDERWAVSGPDSLLQLRTIPASAFEVLRLRPELALSGPAAGVAGAAATFTVAHQVPDDADFRSVVSVFWTADVGLPEGSRTWLSAGLAPAAVTLEPARRAATVQFTPPAAGPYLVRIAAGGDELLPSPVAFTATAAGAAPPALQLAPPGPARGMVGRASGAFAVALPDEVIVAGPVTITPSDGGAGGRFDPASVVLDVATRSASFVYVPATPGTKQILVSSGGGLGDPAALIYVAEPGRARPRLLLNSPRARSGRRPRK
jgi:hypothetical protein